MNTGIVKNTGVLSKEDKERWIVEHFLKADGREKGGYWAVFERSSPPKPDFLVGDTLGNREHIEVTELLESPSANEGHQRSLENEFDELLEDALQDSKYRGLLLAFYRHAFPNRRLLRSHVADLVRRLDEVLQTNGKEVEWKVRIEVDGQQLRVWFSPEQANNEPRWMHFMFGSSGIAQADRDAYLKGLAERIADKTESQYELSHAAKLVIYDNSRFSLFVNDVKEEVLPHFQGCVHGQFGEIWLLSSDGGTAFKVA